jgi:hypothetical protein
MRDKGEGDVTVKGANASIILKSKNQNGSIQFDFEDAKLDIADYQVIFKGHSDISKGMTLLINNFKDFFKKEIINILSRRLMKTIE